LKESSKAQVETTVKSGHPSLDMGFEFDHTCPMIGGAAKYSLYLEKKGLWPPTAPIFHVGGTSLFRRFLRHFWLESHAGFTPFMLIDSPPGFGKSSIAWNFGRCLDPDFNFSRYLYDHEQFMTALFHNPPMSVHAFDDATATRVLWGRDSTRGGQKEAVANILGHARNRKQMLLIISQSGYQLDRILREDIRAIWVNLVSRNPITGEKIAELYYPKQVLLWSRHGGYLLGKPTIYRLAGRMIIPPTPASVMKEYEKVREIGFGLTLRDKSE